MDADRAPAPAPEGPAATAAAPRPPVGGRRLTASSAHIRGFDGLRALALIAVFLQHNTDLGRTTEMGSHGVWLFFVLSGFLIIRILHRERKAVEAGEVRPLDALKRFFWRRVLRIMPIYYLVLAVFAVLGGLGVVHDFRFPDALWHVGYVSNVYFGEVIGLWAGRFGYFWSLAVEEQFYLLAAPVLLFTPSRMIRNVCGAVVLAAFTQHLTMRLEGASAIQVYTNSLVNFGALAFGGFVALSLPSRPGEGARSAPTLACLGAVAAAVYGFTRVGPLPQGTAGLVDGLPLTLTTIFAGLALAAIYLNQSSRLVRVLEWGPLAGLGRISYGLYLYHNLLPHWMLTGFLRRHGWQGTVPEAVEAAFMFACTLAMALASWRLIERPLLSLKDRPPRPELILARVRRGAIPEPA